jgi:hypothetical protein
LWPLAILAFLVGALAWLKIKPVNPQTKEVYPHGNIAHCPKETCPASATESCIPESVSHHEKSPKKKHKVPNWVKFVVNVLTLAAVTWYAVEAWKQRRAMGNMLIQTRRQTILLQQQTQAALEAVIMKQFMIAGRQNKPYLRIVLTNRGRVAASSVRADFQLTLVSISTDGNIIKPELPLPNWTFVVPEIPPSVDSVSERGIYLTAVRNELAPFPRIRKAIKLTGVVTYSNGFQEMPDRVCNYIINATQFKNKGGSIQLAPPASILCDELPNQIAWLEENTAPD